MTGLFEVLASTDDPAGSRAVIAAQSRAKSVFERFVGGDESKLAYITDDLKKMAAEVADEYGYDDPEKLYLAATIALGGGHAADCTCGFCENKGSFGKDDDADDEEKGMEKEASVKTSCDCPAHDGGECTCGDDCDCAACGEAKLHDDKKEASVSPRVLPLFDWERIAAGPELADSYQQETVDLPSSETGLGGPSPKIDKAKSGDQTGWNLEPIDVGSKKHQLEHQDATDRAEYNAEDFDPSNPVRERIDADTALQPEHTFADNTETWSDKSTQADPVTSKWKLLG